MGSNFTDEQESLAGDTKPFDILTDPESLESELGSRMTIVPRGWVMAVLHRLSDRFDDEWTLQDDEAFDRSDQVHRRG